MSLSPQEAYCRLVSFFDSNVMKIFLNVGRNRDSLLAQLAEYSDHVVKPSAAPCLTDLVEVGISQGERKKTPR